MKGKNGGRDTSVGQKTAGNTDREYIEDVSTGQTVARTDRTQYQQSQLSQSQQSQLSIFLSVNRQNH